MEIVSRLGCLKQDIYLWKKDNKISKSNAYITCVSATDFKPPSFYSYLISPTSPKQEGKMTSNGAKEICKVTDFGILGDLMMLCFYDFLFSV